MKVIAPHRLILVATVVAGCLATYFSYTFSLHLVEKEAGSRFNETAKVRVVEVNNHLQASQNILWALKAFYDSSDNVTEIDFASFTTMLASHDDAVSLMAWIEKEPRGNTNTKESYRLRHQYIAGYPDMFSLNASIINHLQASKESVEISRMRLKKTAHNDKVLLSLPVYVTTDNNDLRNEKEVKGFIVMMLDVTKLIAYAINSFPVAPVKISVLEGEQVLGVVQSGGFNSRANTENYLESSLSYSEDISFSRYSWKILTEGESSQFYTHTLLRQSILFLGLLITLLLAFIVNMTIKRHEQVIELVEKRTVELQKANQQVLKQSHFLESEVEARTKDLLQEKEKAESANQAKSVFLSSMSHELRTPLNAILGFAQLLKYDSISPLNEEQNDNVHEILNASDHLLTLINQVLELAKIEAGYKDCSIEVVELKAVLDDCLTLVHHLAIDNDITIELEDSFDIRLLANTMKLKQVILNLLTNAIKYNQAKGLVSIMGNKTEEGRFRLSVKDTGVGMPDDKQELIFKAFSRLGMEDTNIEGTGIGLVVTKELVELMNGVIGFKTAYGKGSTFWIEFALVEP